MSDEFGNAGMGTTEAEVQDFSADGLPTGKDHTFTIENAEEVEKENGTQWQFVLVSETVPMPITVREWISHSTEAAQRIGRGNLKKLFSAVLGQPKGSYTQLVGKKVIARLIEDKEGFAKLNGWKQAPKEVAPVAI